MTVAHCNRPDYGEHMDELLAAGRRGDAVAYFLTSAVGMPEGVVAGMRADPSWSGMEASAPDEILYDERVMGDTMRGNPAPLGQWVLDLHP